MAMAHNAAPHRPVGPHAAEAGRFSSHSGFAMVALLVGMSVAAIWMTAAIPAWRQQVQREREADLIFRGEQYARAIVLFQAKNQNALPPSIDVLVEQHFLRKKWKDPITNDDFIPVGTGGLVGQPGAGGAQQPGATLPAGRGLQPTQTPAGAQGPVGITGVRSKSTATSIKVYQNQQQHNLWQFDAALMRAVMGRQPGLGQQPGGRPDQPGGRDGGAGNRGGQPPGIGTRPGPGGTPPAGGRGGSGGVPATPIGRGRGL